MAAVEHTHAHTLSHHSVSHALKKRAQRPFKRAGSPRGGGGGGKRGKKKKKRGEGGEEGEGGGRRRKKKKKRKKERESE